MKFFHLSSIAALAFAVTFLPARAQIIADNFDRTGDLNNSHPSTPQSSNPTEVWAATSTGDFTLDSTGLLTSTGAETVDNGTAVADLPFTFTAGNVYKLSAILNPGATGQWLAFGFQEGTDISSGAPYIGVSPWLLLKPDGTIQVFTGPDVTGGASYSTTSGSHDFSLVLDTTGSTWNYTAYADNTALESSPVSFSSNPAIDHLFIEGYQNTTGTISNFSLTTTPEPQSAALLFAGLLGLVALARRLHSVA